MAMIANLETYVSTVIKLALESDVGVLFGASKRIDGIEIIKYGRTQPFDFEDKVVSCTKGEWGSRIRSYENIFGTIPPILQSNISALEKLRKLRNNVGHAFGRDIETSRKHELINTSKMQRLNREKTIKNQRLIYSIAREIDKQLKRDHIGEYQALYFYHNLRPSLKHGDSNQKRQLGNHVYVLKKSLGRYGAALAGKTFCKGLIQYYESI